VPAPVYAAPVVSGYYAAPMVSQPIYAYAPGYWGGYGHGWRGYGQQPIYAYAPGYWGGGYGHGWRGDGHRYGWR
jgi:hypothetical protein